MKIQDYINNRDMYAVDPTYQRDDNAWSTEDRQCLIDTILKGEPMPIFFFNEKDGIRYVVDGQQRLKAVRLFYDNEFKLNGKFSGTLAEKTFNGKNALDEENKRRFLDYDLKVHLLPNYDDERVRMIFSRLQRGKQLTLGERLNAKPGTIVECMRELAKHPFLSQSIGVPQNRYGIFPDAARILFYERHGAKDAGSEALYTFFEECDFLTQNSKEYRTAISVLNYLEKCFPASPGGYKHLEKHAWVLAVYTMIRQLRVQYSLQGQHGNISAFIKDFHGKVYNEDWRKSNYKYQRFYTDARGGWSEKLITTRRDLLIEMLREKYPTIPELDAQRQITDEQKIAIFGVQNHKCACCHKELTDFRSAEYHHIIRYTDGGPTDVDNIEALCPECHQAHHNQ